MFQCSPGLCIKKIEYKSIISQLDTKTEKIKNFPNSFEILLTLKIVSPIIPIHKQRDLVKKA